MTGHPNRRPIQSPPAGSTADDDRDDACADAIEPHLSRLLARADAAGWARPETLTAILSLVVSEMRAGAGDRVTRDTLSQVIFHLDD